MLPTSNAGGAMNIHTLILAVILLVSTKAIGAGVSGGIPEV